MWLRMYNMDNITILNMVTIIILNMVTIIILNMVTITNWSLEVMPQGSTGRNLADALLTKEVLLNIILIWYYDPY